VQNYLPLSESSITGVPLLQIHRLKTAFMTDSADLLAMTVTNIFCKGTSNAKH
jgi:hypothetical protein